ncbi:Uncharacterised protein [Mycobacteroides abscessus subsp. abscessus]|nr:Uncharacterised protein [Mycobacteroides abscessus subsp. abscessus]
MIASPERGTNSPTTSPGPAPLPASRCAMRLVI